MTTTTDAPGVRAAEGESAFLTADQVASALGIAKTSVYDRLSRGDLAYHRVGRLVRIRRADLNAYLDRTRVDACAPRRHAHRQAA